MNGVDTFEYWMYVEQIRHGHLHTVFNRLSAYAINLAAVIALDESDYAMRFAVGMLSLANGAATFWLTWRLGRNGIAAVAAAAAYCLLPIVVYFSRVELPHIYSGTYVLATTAALISAMGNGPRRAATLAAGFFAALSLLTHEDLLLVLAACGMILAVTPPAARRSGRLLAWPALRPLATDAALVLAGVAAAFALCAAITHVGPREWVDGVLKLHGYMAQHTGIRIQGRNFAGAVGPRILADFLPHTVGWILVGAALAVAAGLPLAWRAGWLEPAAMRRLAVPAIIAATYVTLFTLTSDAYLEGDYQRIFIPFIPLVLIFTFAGIAVLVPRRGLAALLAIVLAGAAVHEMGGPSLFPGAHEASPHRRVYDAVKTLVRYDERLLLPACYFVGARFIGLLSSLYLGDRAVALNLTAPDVDFATLVQRDKVRYVLVATRPLTGMMPAEAIRRIFTGVYGIPVSAEVEATLHPPGTERWTGETNVMWSPPACALEAEAERGNIARLGGRMVATVPDLAEIYDLGRREPPRYTLAGGTVVAADGKALPKAAIDGWVEAATREGSGFRISGWAFDATAPAPVLVVMFVDGVQVFARYAHRRRPEVDAQLHVFAPAAGFDFFVPDTAAGRTEGHSVTFVAITEAGRAAALLCNPKHCVFPP